VFLDVYNIHFNFRQLSYGLINYKLIILINNTFLKHIYIGKNMKYRVELIEQFNGMNI
jgi:hypothetical protein